MEAKISENKLLTVRNLKVYFPTPDGTIKAVDDISFDLQPKETLAIVGESGCGKSVTAQSIMGLIKSPPALVEGSIKFNGVEILKSKEIENVRGKKISMVFQEPMASFDPLYTIGYQLSEVAMKHLNVNRQKARELCIELLKRVHIPEAEKRFDEYPHQMSGGMLQRVMIALALLTKPDIVIADEPTTALDVTIQAQVLNLLNELKEEFKMSTIFITHDLGIVAEIADNVIVMYAGKIVERAPVSKLFKKPLHPYTMGLLESKIKDAQKGKELPYIPGFVPSSSEIPSGCAFHPRCKFKMKICEEKEPDELKIEDRSVKCHLYNNANLSEQAEVIAK